MTLPVSELQEMRWKPDLRGTTLPLYLALAERLEHDIRTGRLPPGTKLPPQRILADHLGVNLSTVTRAFKVCGQKGLICAAVGSGTFVASDTAVNTLLWPAGGPRILELGSIFPDGAPNEVVAEVMKKMAAEPDFGALFRYGAPGGTPWQREAGARWIAKTGYRIPPDVVLVSGGGQNAVAAVLAGMFRPGDRIGTDPVTYPGVKTAASLLGIRLVPVHQERGEMTEEGILYACKNENIKGLYLIPDLHNPTTRTLPVETRKMIAGVAVKKNLIVVEDGINSFLPERPLPPVAMYAPERTIYIASLSKVLSPGLRLAFLAVPPAWATKVGAALYGLNVSVSPLLAELAARLIQGGKAESIVKAHRAHALRYNALVDRILGDCRIDGPPEGNFRWLWLPERFTGEQFERRAYQAGVQVFAAERFAVGSGRPPRAARLAVTAAGSAERLETALKILKNLLENDAEEPSFY